MYKLINKFVAWFCGNTAYSNSPKPTKITLEVENDKISKMFKDFKAFWL